MGMFPWDEAFYHVKEKSARVNSLYNQYQHQRTDIGTHGDALRNRVDSLQYITGYTNALLITAAASKMGDDDYHQFLSDNDLNKPPKVEQAMVAQVLEGIAELAGVASLGTLVFKLGKLAKIKYFTRAAEEAGAEAGEDFSEMISEDAVEELSEMGMDEAADAGADSIGEAASEAGVEAGSEAAVEATAEAVAEATVSATSVACAAGGIFVAIAIDAIIGAIAGAKESEELEKQTDVLEKGLKVVTDFLAKIAADKNKAESYIIEQINKFKTVMVSLESIQPANFNYNFDVNLNHIAQWKDAVKNAGHQYFYIAKVKNDFHNYLVNWNNDNPNTPFSKALFPMWKSMAVASRPTALTKDQASRFIDYVASNYPEMGQYAS